MRNESGTHVPTKKAPYFGHLWPVVELWNKKTRIYTNYVLGYICLLDTYTTSRV